MRYLRNLTSKQLRGKTALLRVDFNVENKRDAYRLQASLPTINFLLARGAKVVILSAAQKTGCFSTAFRFSKTAAANQTVSRNDISD